HDGIGQRTHPTVVETAAHVLAIVRSRIAAERAADQGQSAVVIDATALGCTVAGEGAVLHGHRATPVAVRDAPTGAGPVAAEGTAVDGQRASAIDDAAAAVGGRVAAERAVADGRRAGLAAKTVAVGKAAAEASRVAAERAPVHGQRAGAEDAAAVEHSRVAAEGTVPHRQRATEPVFDAPALVGGRVAAEGAPLHGERADIVDAAAEPVRDGGTAGRVAAERAVAYR